MKLNDVCYKFKDGRFLKTSYMGDGEYELILTKKITKDCLFSVDWSLSEILNCCDSVYDDKGEYIADTLDKSDFIIHNTEININ